MAGLVINKDDGSGEAAAFAETVKIPILASIPQDDDLEKEVRKLSHCWNKKSVGRPVC